MEKKGGTKMSSTIGKSPCNLLLRGTKFYYRRVISEDVYGRIGMKEIKISLQTSNARLGYSNPGVKSKKIESLLRWLDNKP